MQIATPSVVRKVLRLKAERPSLFASEIREMLLSQRLCDPSQVPSVSSINRILREAATATSSLATEWPLSSQMMAQQFFSTNPAALMPPPIMTNGSYTQQATRFQNGSVNIEADRANNELTTFGSY